MLNFVNETTSLWDYLKSQRKPIVIYGMGDGAIKIMNVCESKGIKIAEIFASNDYVRGHSFLGYEVKTLAKIEEEYSDFIILLAFATFEDSLLNKIYSIAEKHELYAPDVPVFGDGLFTYEYFIAHQNEFNEVYENLADDFSKKAYSQIINFKISGKIEYLKSISTTRFEDYSQLLPLFDGMTYVDLGAYDGDTIQEILSHDIKPDLMIAFEPDVKNFRKLKNNTDSIENIELYNIGSFSHNAILHFNNKAGRNSALGEDGKIVDVQVDSVDNILCGRKADYIKMDVEGAELETLKGCLETIKSFKTALGVAAYHRNEDLFVLPKLILESNPNYKLYIRHNHYIPAWETIIYAVNS
ncbi:MAG: FkbM family methyltransferase [Oscillospiraceae bacterium]